VLRAPTIIVVAARTPGKIPEWQIAALQPVSNICVAQSLGYGMWKTGGL
jgi:hypothetical protein